MPLKNYGVLVVRPIDRRLASDQAEHYQILTVDNTDRYRIAINMRSSIRADNPVPGSDPRDLLYFISADFQHPITQSHAERQPGFHPLPCAPEGGGLDHIRGNLFPLDAMRPAPLSAPGPDNDLNEFLDAHIRRAMSEEDAMVYAFGERWGPEPNRRDRYFGFLPGNGIHDIHMNQGNAGRFQDQNGVWQDGGLLIHFPGENRWAAVFLRFQSQWTHTDDITGHAIAGPVIREDEQEPLVADGALRIVAAVVSPMGTGKVETVTILNTSPMPVSLRNWAVVNGRKKKHVIDQDVKVGTGETATIALPARGDFLPRHGDIITLYDPQGLKVHGASYTARQAERKGWAIAFCH